MSLLRNIRVAINFAGMLLVACKVVNSITILLFVALSYGSAMVILKTHET